MSVKNSNQLIDGKLFSLMVRNAAASLKENIDIVNNLNVFPVPEGDSGDNMYLTIKAGLDALINNDSGNL